jgi:hypothetical protein
MKNHLIVILPLSMSLFLISCSPCKLIVNPKYSSGTVPGGRIAVVIKDKSPAIAYRGNVEPEFGPGNQDSLILAFFKSQVGKDIVEATRCTGAAIDNCSTDGYYDHATVSIKNEDIEMNIPASGTYFTCPAEKADYILFIDKVFIGTSLETTTNAPMWMPAGPHGGMMMVGGGSSTKKKLTCSSTVILWDNTSKCYVLYGYVETSAAGWLIPVITMSEWKSVTESYINEIFSKTGLMKN